MSGFTTQLAKAMCVTAYDFDGAWEDARIDHERFMRYATAALEFLTSTDRLVPAGGMALTAEQVEDVRIVTTEEVGGYTGKQFRRWHAAKDRLVDALFPATEPTAVRDGSDLVVVQRSHTAKAVQSWMTLDLWTDLGKNDKDFDAEYERQGFGDLWAILLGEVRALVQATEPAKKCLSRWDFLRCDLNAGHIGSHERGILGDPDYASWTDDVATPDPAEPAEEETKAEGPGKFRKKPVEVESMQYDGKDWRSIAQWMAAHGAPMGRTASGLLRIHTLEGEMTAGSGDWIIRGVQGEFYPCKPDIFAQTYNPASSPVVPAPTETEAGHA